ncbi:RNA-guided pseudouridylation complex pseudouridine synthase subunit Cbf5 [Candidatus Pacearchaeota archaeon]|nr:RNA-guided pseudouridylation complex pseudouridine synthase subunit Cbf5 [Candidatus Pacearchaeota archaeon]
MLDLDDLKRKKSTSDLLKFGIINIDKPSGPTSFTVSEFIKNSLDLNKTSHLGTLDPMVTGVLPVLLGRACRLSDYFMHRDKEYVGIMRLHEDVDEKVLEKELKNFVGKITQLPPVRSRVKREERVREVKEFNILERDGKDVLFSTLVQAGTYIRKLIHDLGETIGGAHMLELRRTKAGMFGEDKIYNLYEFEKAVEEYKKGDDKKLREMIVPAEIISTIIPLAFIKEEALKKCLTGSPLFELFIEKKASYKKDEKIAVFLKSRFIGCYRVVNEGEVIAVPEFVFN